MLVIFYVRFRWLLLILSHRIHGAAIYGNMDPINIPQMLAYMPYMDPMGISAVVIIILIVIILIVQPDQWYWLMFPDDNYDVLQKYGCMIFVVITLW